MEITTRLDSSSGWSRRVVARPGSSKLSWAGSWVLAAGLALGSAAPALAEIDVAQARADMQQIYASIHVLLPLSVDNETFRAPAERQKIRAALAQLAERAAHVSAHVGGDDRRIQFLGGSLSRESRDALERFDDGQIDAAQFYVQRLTDFCVACHSRLPSSSDSPLASDFVNDKELSKLSLVRQAELQVATRRFDDALQSHEAVFASPNIHPAQLLDPLTAYLTVAIRVKNDLRRPIPVLVKLSGRPDLWANLRSDVLGWIATLERYAAQPESKPSLADARALLEESLEYMRYPTDRQVLVHYLLASSKLHRYLEAHAGESGPDVAEAYYLLGLIDSRTSINYFVSEADFYLETAIRLSPGTPISQEAYTLLEEEAVVGWSGSSGTHMPLDVQKNLAALRKLAYPGETGDSPGSLLDRIDPD